ncbi:MAG: adenylate/guanylate cyclase domain-containing protein [Fibrobacterales bacterium]
MMEQEKLLEQKLGELETARKWSPRLIAKLEALIRSDEPWENYRVNPLEFAFSRNLDENEVIDLFLYASKIGIYVLEWRMVCPHCGDTVNSFSSLSNLESDCVCSLCSLSTKAHLDDYVQISFSLSSTIKALPFHSPSTLSIDDFYFRYRLDGSAQVPGGLGLKRELIKSALLENFYLESNTQKDVSFNIKPGTLMGYDMTTGNGFVYSIEGTSTEEQNASATLQQSKWITTPNNVHAGNISLSIKNEGSVKAAFALMWLPEDYSHTILTYERRLTGNRILNTQAFRSLYRTEILGTTEGIGVRDLTLLFTDIKGSTEMYDKIGDLKAFALVQQHFEHLNLAINNNHGAMIKTIGDAVMATFDKPADAMKASLEMLQKIVAYNKEISDGEIILKIGIHRGASIVVTLNDRLDYFGQTVNVAARVQALADGGEICLTDSFYNAPGVIETLSGYTIVAEKANLKGVSETMDIYRIST